MSQQRIVVGVEGSGGAKAALRFAIREALFRQGHVEVITAFQNTYVPAAPDFNYVPLDPIDIEVEVEKMQQNVVDSVLEELPDKYTGVEIRRRLLKGRPADTLIQESEGAAMLVVGSRGRGGFRGLLLGSVSQEIAHHGMCPVVIVRPDLELPPD